MRNQALFAMFALGFFARTGFAQSSQPKVAGGPDTAKITSAIQASIEQDDKLVHAAAIAIDSNNFVEAETACRQLVTSGGGGGLALELLAQALYLQGKDKEALTAYKHIANSGVVFPRTLLPYAGLLLKNGQYEEAVAAYNTGIKRLGFGELIRANNPFSAAESQLPEFTAAIHVAMGVNYSGTCNWVGRGQDDLALAEYKRAVAVAPEFGLANYYLGYGLQQLHKTTEARAAYRQAASLATGDVWKAANAALKKLPAL